MSVADRVQKLIEDGRAEGKSEHDAIRANVEAGQSEEATVEAGRDLIMIEAWTEGIEAAVLEVAHAVDALRAELGVGTG